LAEICENTQFTTKFLMYYKIYCFLTSFFHYLQQKCY